MKNGGEGVGKISGLNLIVKVGECTDEEINEFRESLPEFGRQIFDKINDQGKKMSVVVVGKMSKEEIAAQESYAKAYGGYMVALHDFRNILAILDSCRLDIEEVLAQTEKLINE